MRPETTTAGGGWPERAHRLLAPGAAALLLLAAALGAVAGPLRLDVQLAVLAFVIVLFGPPRLAREQELGRALLEDYVGASWRPALLGLLLGGVALVLIAWWIWPTATLLVVLVVLGLQVGRDAAAAYGRPGDLPIAAAFGGMPLVLPAGFGSVEIGTVLAWVTLEPDPAIWIDTLDALGPPIAIVWFTVAGLAAGRFLRRPGALAPIGELVAGTLLFALAPTLIALACYLALTHGARGLLSLAAELDPRSWQAALVTTIQRSAPLVGAAAALAAFGLVVALFSGVEPQPALAIVPVWGFGAVALPHVALEALDPARRRAGDDFFGPQSPLERLEDGLRRTRRRVARDRPRRGRP